MLTTLKSRIKANLELKRAALAVTRTASSLIQSFRPRASLRYCEFIADWLRFRRAGGRAAILDFYPCLFDRTSKSGIDTHYFYQSLWAFKKILASGARTHVDVGSQVSFIGLLTAITRVTFLDIRPLKIGIPNYNGLAGSIVALPFKNSTISSLSSLHVIEHVGLGRYGDPIDPEGSFKAGREIVRVLAPGGRAYISVPIGRSRVQFNGQRVFSVAEAVALFNGLDLVEMAMVDAPGTFRDDVKPESVHISECGYGSDFGLGLFCFQKRAQ